MREFVPGGSFSWACRRQAPLVLSLSFFRFHFLVLPSCSSTILRYAFLSSRLTTAQAEFKALAASPALLLSAGVTCVRQESVLSFNLAHESTSCLRATSERLKALAVPNKPYSNPTQVCVRAAGSVRRTPARMGEEEENADLPHVAIDKAGVPWLQAGCVGGLPATTAPAGGGGGHFAPMGPGKMMLRGGGGLYI